MAVFQIGFGFIKGHFCQVAGGTGDIDFTFCHRTPVAAIDQALERTLSILKLQFSTAHRNYLTAIVQGQQNIAFIDFLSRHKIYRGHLVSYGGVEGH